jgi:putative SOS response-associated peptidase YedK
VVQNGHRALENFRWGLVPSWAKDVDIATKLINARAETLAEKPSFRTALKKRRCLVPADGFYEWNKAEARQPYHIRRKDGELFAFAGLWDEWRDPNLPSDAQTLRTFTIVTCAPNEMMSQLHHRMAVILRPEDEALWLAPDADDVPSLLDLLQPYNYEDMEAYRIGRAVGRVDSEGPELIAPVEEEEKQTSLF